MRAGQGHVDLADDRVAMGGMFDKAWSSIGGRTFITEAEVKRVEGDRGHPGTPGTLRSCFAQLVHAKLARLLEVERHTETEAMRVPENLLHPVLENLRPQPERSPRMIWVPLMSTFAAFAPASAKGCDTGEMVPLLP